MKTTVSLLLAGALALFAACSESEKDTGKASENPKSEGDRRVAIKVDGDGFHPSEVHAKAGEDLTLVFTRTTDGGCASEVVLASTGERHELPKDEPVEVPFSAEEPGRVAFACGMDMLKGAVVVE